MFILSNCKEDFVFKVTRKNGRITLKRVDKDDSDGVLPLTYKAVETNRPVQYFCFPHQESAMPIETSSLLPAKFFETSIHCEQPLVASEGRDYAELDELWDMKGRRFTKKRANIPTQAPQPIRFTIENQIIPEFNRDATSPKDIYKVDLLFSESALEGLSSIRRDSASMCPLVQNFTITEENRVVCNAIDCLYTVLSHRFLKKEALPSFYSFFYDEIKDDLIGNRLSSLSKDRLTARLYVAVLLLNNLRVSYTMIPKFDNSRARTLDILKAIGCEVSNSGSVTLRRPPAEVSRMR